MEYVETPDDVAYVAVSALPNTFPDKSPENDEAVKMPENVADPLLDIVAAIPNKGPISIPLLAVINPIESTLVTSSYVRVPAIDTFPLKEAVVAIIVPTVISGVPVKPCEVVDIPDVVAYPAFEEYVDIPELIE